MKLLLPNAAHGLTKKRTVLRLKLYRIKKMRISFLQNFFKGFSKINELLPRTYFMQGFILRSSFNYVDARGSSNQVVKMLNWTNDQ